jgi:hypothetical protein
VAASSLAPDVLYDDTPLTVMHEWLMYCELQHELLSRWEYAFIVDLREIFETNVGLKRLRPFSGRQLSVLKQIWERLP